MNTSLIILMLAAITGSICLGLLIVVSKTGNRQIDRLAEWFVPPATIFLYVAAALSALLALIEQHMHL